MVEAAVLKVCVYRELTGLHGAGRGQPGSRRVGFLVESELQSASTAEAIPDAINHYYGLYGTLVRTLLQDPDFVAAARR